MLLVALTDFVTRHKRTASSPPTAPSLSETAYLLTVSCARRRVHPLGHAEAA
jgi:hypothetical protein